MNIIKLLDKNTIDKIAAGEVVDRPSSIVKELCENSIDSGATAISVEIKDGGKSAIRVTDNGCGIEKSQIKTAFLRHSTSKISSADDLSFISTLGFRGEALSSIAAVSKLELCSKTADSLTGSIYKISGGEEISLEDAGLPNGTTIIVRDLFFNTPARLKFLKTSVTEAGYVIDTVEKLALSHPSVSFKLVSNGAAKLVTSGNGSLKDAVYAVYGREVASRLYPLSDQNDYIALNGFIGKPEIARGNKGFEIYFINGRYIKDKVIERAIEDAYKTFQMKGSFPFTCFNLQIEPELIDVNVHPSKMEIRFFDNETVYNSIYSMINSTLRFNETIPEVTLRKPEISPISFKAEAIPEPFETVQKPQPVYEYKERTVEDYFRDDSVMEYTVESPKKIEPFTEKIEPFTEKKPIVSDEQIGEQQTIETSKFIAVESRPKHRLIGEVFETYWLVEFDDSLYIIDQHAAHEKVLYEQFLSDFENGRHYSQNIAPPIIISLTYNEENALLKCMNELDSMGFSIEHYGGKEYAVNAVPTDLYGLNSVDVIIEMIDELADIKTSSSPDLLLKQIASASCKAAVKGNKKISFSEANGLIDRLLSLENPYNCPHGRPTIIKMSKNELEKKFKRLI